LACEGWETLSGRAQILLAAASRLDQQIQERITLERMCHWLELDAHNLTAAFKQFHGCSMSAYLQQFRVRCLFHALAAEPQASLLSLFRRYGLGPTPSERRCFRQQFGLSIEAHQQHCRTDQAGVKLGQLVQPGLSATEEALAKLAGPKGAGGERLAAGCGRPTAPQPNPTSSAAGPLRLGC
jgi:methylphosphotriester-DNA--protein-cysteine methyltransferase